ncbi:MAG: hypothetical protein ACE5F9_15370 [Phycisphaerae bacterium]
MLKVLVAGVALCVAGFGDRRPARPNEVATPAAEARRPVRSDGPFRGLSVQLHCNSANPDVYDHYHALVPEVAKLGADTILFVVHAWQEHAGSLDLQLDPRRTPSERDIGRLCDLARTEGLRVILMPVVLLKQPRNNEWRGQIVPKDHNWDGWFRRYTQVMLHFAKLAERHQAAVLMIGSELIKAERYTARWRRLIEEIRQHYRGKLGYSANWDHYQTEKIGFWPELDYVGMTTYYKLADGPKPSEIEIEAHWKRIKSDILAFQKEVNRPILFTEVGWCSQEGAASEAWNYYHNQKATPEGHAEQAACYRTFLRVWAAEPVVGGIIWWEWDDTAGGRGDYNYTPRGKPAERVLRRWLAGKHRSDRADEKEPVPTAVDRGAPP